MAVGVVMAIGGRTTKGKLIRMVLYPATQRIFNTSALTQRIFNISAQLTQRIFNGWWFVRGLWITGAVGVTGVGFGTLAAK